MKTNGGQAVTLLLLLPCLPSPFLQYAIEAAEEGDYSELHTLLDLLRRPYEEHPGADPKYSAPPPEEMVRPGVCMLSCSS
jgi:uncharacterized protein YdiU (UPF0061 family)